MPEHIHNAHGYGFHQVQENDQPVHWVQDAEENISIVKPISGPNDGNCC